MTAHRVTQARKATSTVLVFTIWSHATKSKCGSKTLPSCSSVEGCDGGRADRAPVVHPFLGLDSRALLDVHIELRTAQRQKLGVDCLAVVGRIFSFESSTNLVPSPLFFLSFFQNNVARALVSVCPRGKMGAQVMRACLKCVLPSHKSTFYQKPSRLILPSL